MENVMSKGTKLPISEKFGYAFSGVAFCFCQLIPTFLVCYATQSLLLSIGAVTLIYTGCVEMAGNHPGC